MRGKRIWIGQPKPSDQLRKAISLWAAQYYGRWALANRYYGSRHSRSGMDSVYSNFDPFLNVGSDVQRFLGQRLQEWGLNTTENPRAAEYRLEGEFLTFDEVRSSSVTFLALFTSPFQNIHSF
jgi:hypothetical protein